MALGFNNAPVDWTQMSAGQDQSGQAIRQGLQSVGMGIQRYQENKKQKQETEMAISAIKRYLPKELADDPAAAKAVINQVGGAGETLKLFSQIGQVQQQQTELQNERSRLSAAISTYNEEIDQGNAKDAVSSAIERYAKAGGVNIERVTSALVNDQRVREQQAQSAEEQKRYEESKAQREAELKRTEQQVKESEARTQALNAKMARLTTGEGGVKPIAVDVPGLAGWKAVPTDDNGGWRYIESTDSGMNDKERLAALARMVDKTKFDEYMKKSRKEDGSYNDDGLGWGRRKINPLYEAYAAAINLPAYQRTGDNEIKPLQGNTPSEGASTAPANPNAAFLDIFQGLQ